MDDVDDRSNIIAPQRRVVLQPYSIVARTKLAKAYQATGYPDLAAGEAYIALLLLDEALGASGEFEDEAFDASARDYLEEQRRESSNLNLTHHEADDGADAERDERTIAWIKGPVREGIYTLLIENLVLCNNLKQANAYMKDLRPNALAETQRLQHLLEAAVKSHAKDADQGRSVDELPEWGRVRREVYPWNEHEPDRSSQESLIMLNELLSETAPKLEARITVLPDLTMPGSEETVKQIGLFAKHDIPPGQQVLREKSILTATARLNDAFCDACAAKLAGLHSGDEPVSCAECYETVFCGAECHELAQQTYHPALCGKDTTSLGKDAAAKDAADSLYALLLLRTFALAVQQEMHPLDLVQTKYLWGDFLSSTPSLPFNLNFNVILPLTMLEKMEVNIFTSSTQFNTWTFNTLYSKFRGTADAKQGPDGKPEIGAVHPLWCLANHSCDPNVRWEWDGEMGFWARTKAQKVAWRPDQEEVSEGLKEGDEVLGHYCDVELTVAERREWARGALGGDCMCERCVWESTHPDQVRNVKIQR